MATTTKTNKSTKTTTIRETRARAPRVVETTLPDEYTPISMWGYFGYELLFSIPVIGWIFCICFAFGAHNLNLRNFARSQFCWLIIGLIAFCLFWTLGGIALVATIFGK